MKMDIFFHSMESSFHPCRAQGLFSTSEEIRTAHLLSTYMKKPNAYEDKPGKTTTAMHCLRGKNYPIFPKMKYFTEMHALERKHMMETACTSLPRQDQTCNSSIFCVTEGKLNAILISSMTEIHCILSVQSSNILKYSECKLKQSS